MGLVEFTKITLDN
jgi:uncharacterized coiled-coil protein SlyX